MNLVNTEGKDEITFETLGNFFQLVDVYKEMDEDLPNVENKLQEDKVRRQKEVKFHKSFWKLFSDDYSKTIKIEPVIEIFLQLYTSNLDNSFEAEHILNSNIKR